MNDDAPSLADALSYEPVELRFGTSGRRGRVVDLSQLEIYLNARAELDYLQSLPRDQGGVRPGQPFYFARDLRPSSDSLVPSQGGRGEIAQTIAQAVSDAQLRPVNLGRIPTPALTAYALARKAGSVMITGSHIPFDRNGYKTNTTRGELMKQDERPIAERVRDWRRRLYQGAARDSLFDARGMFKTGARPLAEPDPAARDHFMARFTDFFADRRLDGMRLLVYQHSAVGRDLLVEILERFGADAVPAGRSDRFVPIDTENIDASTLAAMQALIEDAAEGRPFDAVVSTDGDSDRPLIVGVDNSGTRPRLRFFGGDLLGMVVAQELQADAAVVPISCNDGVDRGPLASILAPKTKIGSPYVIAGMNAAAAGGRHRVCGWEANGGFLTGSPIERQGRVLPALPTRDAFLPILCCLFAARDRDRSLARLFDALPRRYSKASLLREFPRAASLSILRALTPQDAAGAAGARPVPKEIQSRLERAFPNEEGFARPQRVDYTDGVRVLFDDGDVAHIRPSGNADELRIYAVADTQERADAIAAAGVREPDGILRRLAEDYAD